MLHCFIDGNSAQPIYYEVLIFLEIIWSSGRCAILKRLGKIKSINHVAFHSGRRPDVNKNKLLNLYYYKAPVTVVPSLDIMPPMNSVDATCAVVNDQALDGVALHHFPVACYLASSRFTSKRRFGQRSRLVSWPRRPPIWRAPARAICAVMIFVCFA